VIVPLACSMNRTPPVFFVCRFTVCETPKSKVRVQLAAGSRVATTGQLLFAPRAWAYSTLHYFGVVTEYRLRLGRLKADICATLLAARHVPEVALSTWSPLCNNVELYLNVFTIIM